MLSEQSRRRRTDVALLVTGMLLIVFAATLASYWKQLLYFHLQREMILSPDSSSFKVWWTTSIPVYFRVYFWNWTNPHEYNTSSSSAYKPNFVEMGPYTFRTNLEKVNITWNENGTVTFRRIKRYWFEESMSVGKLSDNITSINAVAASASSMTKNWKTILQYPLSVAMRATQQKIHWTHSVRELMFEGLENKLHKLANTLPDLTGSNMPKMERFGWFYNQNNTIEPDVYNIDTGQGDIVNIGKLHRWNYKDKIGHYWGECDDVRGWYGEIWPPKFTKQDQLVFLTTEMCRPLTYYYEEETKYKGLNVYKYSASELTLDNGTVNSANECFNNRDSKLDTGVFNRSSCSYGTPLFFSFPHFYLADKSYVMPVDGMRPDKRFHSSYVKLDPKTGIQVEVIGRFQLNFLLEKNENLALFENVKTTYFPVLWCEMDGSLTHDYIMLIRLFNFALVAGRPAMIVCFTFGLILVVIGLFLTWRRSRCVVEVLQSKMTSVKMNPTNKDESAEKLML